MRFLLDTQALIWYYEDKSKLGEAALEAIEDKDSERYISMASIWEMNIKSGLGKLNLSAPIPDIVLWCRDEGMELLQIMEAHAHGVRMLPILHKDPLLWYGSIGEC